MSKETEKSIEGTGNGNKIFINMIKRCIRKEYLRREVLKQEIFIENNTTAFGRPRTDKLIPKIEEAKQIKKKCEAEQEQYIKLYDEFLDENNEYRNKSFDRSLI